MRHNAAEESAVRIAAVPPAHIKLHRDYYSAQIKRATDHSLLADDVPANVLESLMIGKRVALDVVAGDYRALAVIEVAEGKAGGLLHVYCLSGEGLDYWLEALYRFLKGVVKVHNLAGIALTGRPGWARKLRPLGFKVKYNVMVDGLL